MHERYLEKNMHAVIFDYYLITYLFAIETLGVVLCKGETQRGEESE